MVSYVANDSQKNIISFICNICHLNPEICEIGNRLGAMKLSLSCKSISRIPNRPPSKWHDGGGGNRANDPPITPGVKCEKSEVRKKYIWNSGTRRLRRHPPPHPAFHWGQGPGRDAVGDDGDLVVGDALGRPDGAPVAVPGLAWEGEGGRGSGIPIPRRWGIAPPSS